MTSDLLQRALEMLKTHDVKSSQEVDAALAELHEVQKLYERDGDRQLCKDAVYVVPALTVIDLINIIAYDDYGELYRAAGNKPVVLSDFVSRVRRTHSEMYLTDTMIADGYYFVSDLFQDNELIAANDAQGHFAG